ncbi:hypothetical protein [Nocardia terpenica]|uniref:Cobalamin-independent methionine synthase MetE C-terminal/archaeal domain-containing protein n=1 Tax=Nocardia terpenica TaxID=455432 RepID=A0A161XB96_9NOCA|nr:hypothetical protein [Nocardia terpenica]KZM70428.1 hypothetical protein AWN90_03875 [Nocardia terpenica]NQE91110.1 hypothetical protein [Nocardia terpenica]
MTTRVHFVGSLPAALRTSHSEVLEWFVKHAGRQQLTAVPCDLDPGWLIAYLRELATRTEVLELTHSNGAADYADYDHIPTLRPRTGVTLEPADLAMDRIAAIGDIVGEYRALQHLRPELEHTRVQISQPNPLDMSLFAFAGSCVAEGLQIGPGLHHLGQLATAMRLLPVVTEAVLEEMERVVAAHGDGIVWQVESPVALLSMVKAVELRARWAVTGRIARQLADLLARADRIGAATSLHLCYGDHEHQALLAPRDLAPAVVLLNAVALRLRRSRTPLPVVHIPCAHGAEPAPLDPEFYAPLHRLDPGWTVIAGVVSAASIPASIHALGLFEEAAGRPAYAVATACGLGRCTVETAERAAAATAATAASRDA